MENLPQEPILIVDDDPACCASMAEALEKAGYRVESTTDAVAAVFRTLKRKYALLVADLGMPTLLGTALVAEVRRANPGMPAVIVSGFPDQRAIADAKVLGVPVLSKPFSLDAILTAVREQLSADGARSLRA